MFEGVVCGDGDGGEVNSILAENRFRIILFSSPRQNLYNFISFKNNSFFYSKPIYLDEHFNFFWSSGFCPDGVYKISARKIRISYLTIASYEI